MHSVKRILTTENRTCANRPTAIQSYGWLPDVTISQLPLKKVCL